MGLFLHPYRKKSSFISITLINSRLKKKLKIILNSIRNASEEGEKSIVLNFESTLKSHFLKKLENFQKPYFGYVLKKTGQKYSKFEFTKAKLTLFDKMRDKNSRFFNIWA